jgi:parvulin-like peptidyl-prolyl isomerase
MIKRAFIALLICAAAAVAGCRGRAADSPAIATIDSERISLGEFNRFLTLKLGEFAEQAPDALRSEMLDEYIRRRVLVAAATRAGVAVSDAEVEQAVQDNPHLKSSAAAADTRLELARDLLIEKYYKQLIRDSRVSAEEVQQYIEQNQDRLTDRPGFFVREIRTQSKEEADRLRQEVTEGGRDFASIARMHSDAPNAEGGGLSRYDEDQLPDLLEKAIAPLRPGDVSPVIHSNYGYHIFKLERRVQPVPIEERRSQLDDRRDMLTEELISRKNQQAIDAAVDALLAKAAISIEPSALGFTYSGKLGHNSGSGTGSER